MSNNKIEIRTRELRAESQGDGMAISGYAALFNSPSKDLGGFNEIIAPGAFDRAIAEKQPVKFTFNHSMDAVLARTDNGTLTLGVDPHGLKFRAVLNKNITQHRDLWEACRSGLYNECSFAFKPAANGQTWSADGTTRTLTNLDIYDVSMVGDPAYSGTACVARSAGSNAELLAKVLAMPSDWKRQERAAAIGKEIMAELFKTPETRMAECAGNQDWFSMRDLDCEDADCDCQNVLMNPDDMDDEDSRAASDKVRTKTVGGKSLTADKFAFVGDPDRTETWKLPIHDAAHVRNALARFNQTEGIPASKKDAVYAKIVAAATKFDIEVSDDSRSWDSLRKNVEAAAGLR